MVLSTRRLVEAAKIGRGVDIVVGLFTVPRANGVSHAAAGEWALSTTRNLPESCDEIRSVLVGLRRGRLRTTDCHRAS